ncbi:hypothetical protein L6R50_19090 [Myxococcota bacterium]|nr:hypothetical protein [Myxococcota bacterium]
MSARFWAVGILAGALGVASAGCDAGGKLLEEASAAQQAGDLDTAARKYAEYLGTHTERDPAYDGAALEMGKVLVAQVEAVSKSGDLEAAYQKMMEVEAGEWATAAAQRLEALKNSDAGLTAIAAYKQAMGEEDLNEAVNRMIEVAESGTKLAAQAKTWLVDKVAQVYLPQCLDPAANPKMLPGPDVVEMVQSHCDYVITYAPDSEDAKKAKAAKEGPLAKRLAEVNAEMEREMAKEKAKAAKSGG